MGLKRKVKKFFRKLGFGRRRHEEVDRDEGESGPSNTEVVDELERAPAPPSETPTLDLLGGVDGDNALSEVDSESDEGWFGWSSTEEDPDEDLDDPGASESLEDDEETSRLDETSSSLEDDEETSRLDETSSSLEDDEETSGSSSSVEDDEDTSGSWSSLEDDLSSSVEEDPTGVDEASPSLVEAPPISLEGDVAAVERALAGWVMPRTDVATDVVPDDDGRLDAALERGRAEGRLWSVDQQVYSRAGSVAYGVVDLLQRTLEGYNPVRNLDAVRFFAQARRGHPVTDAEVADRAIDGGYVAEGEAGVEPTRAGLQLLARAGSQDTGRQQGGGDGWSTTPNLKALDDKHHEVVYHDDEARQDTVLQLQGGVFTWVSTGEAAENPDLSNLNPELPEERDEINATSGWFGGARRNELKKQGLTDVEAQIQIAREIQNDPRLIYVMDAGGTFYAMRGRSGEIHHSTMLAGANVAAAGELALSGGVPTYLSNESGHYKPGPGDTWQTVYEMGQQGVNLGGVDLRLAGVGSQIDAQWFLDRFIPGSTGPQRLSMDPKQGAADVEAALKEARVAPEPEPEVDESESSESEAPVQRSGSAPPVAYVR